MPTALVFLAKANEPLLFIVNHPGSLPYLYFDRDKEIYQGIIPDILNGLVETNQLNIKYISNSRKRSEEFMYQGGADLMMLSQRWLKEPDKLIATVPLFQHRSFLYKNTAFEKDFSLENSTSAKNICTRKGYTYPKLKTYFRDRMLMRVDSSSHLSMLRMLSKNRCDFAIMNEFNALNLINSSFFKDDKFYRSKHPVSIVPLNIILRSSLVREKEILDRHISKLQESGELQDFIDQHTAKPD
ncbi:substrate-binding periplasmic protein [Thalassotalea atypica]|uniref:substrate-binding periplasmic protein n=1 Tax=Thalassotalea atypica TaxID=2054316 RepID=UPI002573CF8E|nr:transporter substrate-binding domain-containing protein [Thalassotalea atypica]